MTDTPLDAKALEETVALMESMGWPEPVNARALPVWLRFYLRVSGERVTDHPACACPVLTRYGIGLNDALPDDVRQRLIPLAWATAGTRSPEHEQGRLRILALAACDIAEMVLPVFEGGRPDDDRPRKAIEAARAYWADPSSEAASAARDAAGTVAEAKKTSKAARAAWASAWAAAWAAWDAAWDTAWASAWAAVRAAQAQPNLAPQIWDRAIQALRDAIEAGPHGGIPEADAVARIEARRHELVGER